jgi:hypothetical protein
MTDPAPAQPPIAIDRIERARGRGQDVRLRLTGRWLTADPPTPSDEHQALLVVQLQGRRHRFAADRAPAGDAPPPGTWQAEFTVPPWAVPERPGQAAVWIGNAVVAVGPPGSTPPAAAPSQASPGPRSVPGPPAAASAPAGPAAAPEPGSPAAPAPAEPPRSGPLADLLVKETVSALHAELERRSAEAAQLRGALADAHSELEARTGRQAALESAHAELRHELEQLMAAVGRQRQDFDERLAAAQDALGLAREQAAMATAARAEAEAEAAQARQTAHTLQERLGAVSDDERRAAHDAAALREQLATAQVSRDAAFSEAGGLRAELGRLAGELTVMREEMSAHGGDLGEAQRLLSDARALTEQLRSGSAE